jgi:DNA-binding NarL/FixJ family response regulator
MRPQAVRIVYAEDQRPLRKLFQCYLEENHHYHLQAVCGNGVDAITAIQKHRPDILLLDLRMPLMNGHEVIDILRHAHSPVKVLVISYYESEKLQLYLLSKDVKGFISKDAGPEELYEAIDLVASGKLYAPAHLVSIRMELDKNEFEARHVCDSDLQLAALVKKGLSNREIYRAMGISESGVEKKKRALITKMGAESLYDAVDALGQEGFWFRKG